MFRRMFFCVCLPAFALLAYSPVPVPLPAEKDVPFLVHGDRLLATDIAVARPRERRFDTVYSVPGEASQARTPLASPVFVFAAERIDVARLQLFRLEVAPGQRELAVQRRGNGGAKPFRISISPLGAGFFRLEVDESLPNGEYALTPDGSNEVFCFTVY